MGSGEKWLRVILVVMIFIIGIVVGLVWDSGFIQGGVTGAAVSVPGDFVEDREILVYDDSVVIKVVGARISNYDGTGSMLPVLGEGVNGITVEPRAEEDIEVGDIVSFRRGGDLIVHRVISKGADSRGVYFITKGDNAQLDDGKVRFLGDREGFGGVDLLVIERIILAILRQLTSASIECFRKVF